MTSWRRVRAIAAKEFRHVLRDIRTLTMAVTLPLFLLLLFGYALTLDVDRIATVVFDRDRTPQSRALIEHLRGSRFFTIAATADDYDTVARLIDRGDCLMAVVIPRGYARRLLSGGRSDVQVLLDGSDSNTAAIALGYATALLQSFDAEIRRVALARRGVVERGPAVEGRLRVWYNPELRARNYIVPGLIALIMMIIGALLTSLTIAREWETGTLEQLLSTPVRPAELVLGKIAPYYLIGMVDMVIAVAAGTIIFGVPLRGSLVLLAATSAVFLLGCLSTGMFISAATRSQTLAFQLGILTSFLPAFLLSGFVYAIENMPVVIQAVTYLVPARYFVALLKGIFLKGAGMSVLWIEAALLAVFAAAMFRAAVAKVPRRLA